jgi:hypothetical protein
MTSFVPCSGCKKRVEYRSKTGVCRDCSNSTPCSEPDCSKTGRKRRGMCCRHYNQWRRKNETRKPCSFTACTNPSFARTMCSKHYYAIKAALGCTEVGCDKPARSGGLCSSHCGPRKKTFKSVTCIRPGCGKTVKVDTTNASRQKFCSKSCCKKPRPLVLYTGPAFRRSPKLNFNTIPTSKRTFKSVQCKVCNTYFVTLFTDVTCSTECQDINDRDMKSQAKSRRRARMKRAFVENVSPKYIFKRDNYRCNLKLSPSCNGKTDPSKVVPHPRAPTVDHVIPLGLGVENDGWHSNANSWCACFECNCIKSDRGGGEQLALIG